MKLDPLTSAYLKVINENASNGKVEGQSLKVGAAFGDSKNDKNTHSFYKDSGVEKVDGDLRGFIMSKLIEKQFKEDGKVKELSGEEKSEIESKNKEIKLILDSVLFQIIYNLASIFLQHS